VLPGKRAQDATQLEIEPLVVWLADRLDRLKPLMTQRVEKRVGLHEHPGVHGAGAAVRKLLEAIPGLEFVDLQQMPVGYMCNTLRPVPAFKPRTCTSISSRRPPPPRSTCWPASTTPATASCARTSATGRSRS